MARSLPVRPRRGDAKAGMRLRGIDKMTTSALRTASPASTARAPVDNASGSVAASVGSCVPRADAVRVRIDCRCGYLNVLGNNPYLRHLVPSPPV
ncbi:MAG: hypothetical protein U5N53_17445 [Mycobacterium sp.]|nr:hypothetical protein [Mycobacterium sp.]